MTTERVTRRRVRSPEYVLWLNMRHRCRSPNSTGYANYGGRGITVCERWNSFELFLADMGRRPTPKHTIERKNNDIGYSPENCCWATRAEQSRNRRTTRLIEFNGKRQCLSDWAAEYGLSQTGLRKRLARGLSIEDALLAPLKRYGALGALSALTWAMGL